MDDICFNDCRGRFGSAFVLFLALLGLAYVLSLAELNSHATQPLPVIGTVADFTLTNQDGQVTTLADLTNHVWVADIIFTRCAGPCPIMTGADEIAAGRAAADQQARNW